eukprot:scaffold156316_cov43-Tisochrysis_lutea.AAC.2
MELLACPVATLRPQRLTGRSRIAACTWIGYSSTKRGSPKGLLNDDPSVVCGGRARIISRNVGVPAWLILYRRRQVRMAFSYDLR